jgi:hypothetical protein
MAEDSRQANMFAWQQCTNNIVTIYFRIVKGAEASIKHCRSFEAFAMTVGLCKHSLRQDTEGNSVATRKQIFITLLPERNFSVS